MRKAFSVQLQCPGSQKKTAALEMIIKRGGKTLFSLSPTFCKAFQKLTSKLFFSFQDIVICLANTAISLGLSYLVVGEALNMEGSPDFHSIRVCPAGQEETSIVLCEKRAP